MQMKATLDITKICELIQSGNELALTNLINLFSSDLYVFAMGFVKQKVIAEELVSDVFVQIWESRDDILTVNNIKAYLYVLVKNKCISHLRKHQKNEFISIEKLEEFHLSDLQSKDSTVIDNDMILKINNAISKLPPRCKMAFVLAKVNDLRYKEIAEIMDISVKTIDNQIAYALKNICASINIPNSTSDRKMNKLISLLFIFP